MPGNKEFKPTKEQLEAYQALLDHTLNDQEIQGLLHNDDNQYIAKHFESTAHLPNDEVDSCSEDIRHKNPLLKSRTIIRHDEVDEDSIFSNVIFVDFKNRRRL